jgi:hypothetical protein
MVLEIEPEEVRMLQSILRVARRIEAALTGWMADNGILLLRLSVGIIFLGFGGLKFFPDLSPAEELAERTLESVSFGLVPPDVGLAAASIVIEATVRGGRIEPEPAERESGGDRPREGRL